MLSFTQDSYFADKMFFMLEDAVCNRKKGSRQYSEVIIKIVLVFTLLPIVTAFMPIFIMKHFNNFLTKICLIISQTGLIVCAVNYSSISLPLPILITGLLVYFISTFLIAIKEVWESELIA